MQDLREHISAALLPLIIILTYSSTVQASTGWPHDFAEGIFFIIIVLPFALIAGWVFIHSWNKKIPKPIIAVISLYDLVVIVFYSILFSFFVLQAVWQYPYGDGFWKPIFLKENVLHTHRLILLFSVAFFILYKFNLFVASYNRIKKLLVHFLLCFSAMLVILTIFEPTIAGPITRWFVDKEKLEKSYGHDSHHSIYVRKNSSGKSQWTYITWLEYYGFK